MTYTVGGEEVSQKAHKRKGGCVIMYVTRGMVPYALCFK